MRSRAAYLLIFLQLCLVLVSKSQANEVEDTIAAVASRACAIVSGRLAFTYYVTTFKGTVPLKTEALPERIASFSGTSWADRDSDRSAPQISRINHNGHLLEFRVAPQPGGAINYSANIAPPCELNSGREAQTNLPPVFAGSFWKTAQLKYVLGHASRCRLVGNATVNEIATEHYELDVPAADHRAFVSLCPGLRNGGAIRFFVAPQLGYLLPRIEFVTPQGEVAQSYEAKDFLEVAPGIFFPKRIQKNIHSASGGSLSHVEFDIRSELINQPIPDDDYIVQFPVGTDVNDARDPEQVKAFRLEEPTPSSAFD
jgi:hypothetical protein